MSHACASCAFWRRINPYDAGECRKNAPQPSQGGYKFPVTDPHVYCGQWSTEFRKDAPNA